VNHVQNILEKLGAHSRLEALAIVFPPGRKSTYYLIVACGFTLICPFLSVLSPLKN
jgi:hypothetical protein